MWTHTLGGPAVGSSASPAGNVQRRRSGSIQNLPCLSSQPVQQPNWPCHSLAPSSPMRWGPQHSRSSVKMHAKRGKASAKAKTAQEPAAAAGKGGWSTALAGVPTLPRPDEETVLPGDEDLLDAIVDDDDDALLGAGEGEDEGFDEDEEGEEAIGEGEDPEGTGDEDEEGEDEDEVLEELEEKVNGNKGNKTVVMPPGGQPFIMETLTYAEAMAEAQSFTRSTNQPTVRVLSAAEVKQRQDDEDAANTKAVVMPEGAQLTLDRQGFQAFMMDKIEFLVAETTDGRLNLKECYVYDTETQIYAPPKVTGKGKLPKGPVTLQVIPWMERKSPDSLKQKEGMTKMKKVYFIGVASISPYRIDMNHVYCFDGASRELKKEVVLVAPGIINDPVLRIKREGVSLEDSQQAPPPYVVAQKREEMMSPEERERRLQERIEELEAQAEELDALDEAPDVSASDMM